MPFGKPIDTAKAPKGFGKPIDTASDGPVQRPASPPMVVDPPVPEAPVSTLHGPTQGDYSRPTQARGLESVQETMGLVERERRVPMGDIRYGYMPSHAAAESTNPLPDIQRPVIEQERPAGLTWDQAQVVMGDLTREQEEAAQQAQPAGDFGTDPDDSSSYGLGFGAGLFRSAPLTSLMTNVGGEEAPESVGGKIAAGAGESIGALGRLMLLGRVAGGIGLGPVSSTAASFAADAAMQPGTPEERGVNALTALPTGLAYGAAPFVPGVGGLFRNPITGSAMDTGSMYAMNKASGMDNEDALIHAAAMAASGRLSHVGGRAGAQVRDFKAAPWREAVKAEANAMNRMAGTRDALKDAISRDPAGEWAALREGADTPIKDSPASQIAKARVSGELTPEQATAKYKEMSKTEKGFETDAVKREAAAEYLIDKEIARREARADEDVPLGAHGFREEKSIEEFSADARASAEAGKYDKLAKAPKTSESILSASKAKQDIRRRVLEKTLPKELVEQVQAGEIFNPNVKGMQSSDRVKNIMTIAKGKQGAAIEKAIVRPQQDVDRMIEADQLAIKSEKADILTRNGIKRDTEESALLTRVLKSWADRENTTPRQAARADAELMADLGANKNADSVLAAAEELGPVLKKNHRMMSDISEAIGGDEVGWIDGYIKKMEKQPRWPEKIPSGGLPRTVGRMAQGVTGPFMRSGRRIADGPESATESRVIGTKKRAVSSTMRRSDGEYKRGEEWDAWRILDAYSNDVVSAIGRRMVVNNAEQVAEYLYLTGNKSAAELISREVQANYGGKDWGLQDATEFMEAGPARRAVAEAIHLNKRGSDRATFKFNPKMALTQLSSLVYPISRHPIAAIKATRNMTNPAAVEAVLNTYGGWAKSGKSRSVASEGVSSNTSRSPLDPRSRTVEKIDDIGSYVTEKTEQFTTAMQGLMAHEMYKGTYKGRDLADAISDEIFRWQSVYSAPNRPYVMNNRLLQGLAPRQSFSLDMYNAAKEMLRKDFGKDYEFKFGNKQAVAEATAVYATIIMANAIRWGLLGYTSFKIKDIVDGIDKGEAKQIFDDVVNNVAGLGPFSATVTGAGPGGGKTFTASSIGDVGRSARDVVDAAAFGEEMSMEDWAKVFSRVSSHYFAGGQTWGRGAEAAAQLMEGDTDLGGAAAKTLVGTGMQEAVEDTPRAPTHIRRSGRSGRRSGR